jgi:hypothetical protein
MREPIVSTDELKTYDRILAPGIVVHITNVPTIINRGGHLPGVREYYTFETSEQLSWLSEMGRLRMAQGETDIWLDFSDNASSGRRALAARRLAYLEGRRKRYDRRRRAVSSRARTPRPSR